jgi:hypothetical protein
MEALALARNTAAGRLRNIDEPRAGSRRWGEAPETKPFLSVHERLYVLPGEAERMEATAEYRKV